DRGGQGYDVAGLDGADHRLCEMIEPGIFGEEAVEHRAEQDRAAALKGLFVERDRDLDAAGDGAAAAPVHPAHHRPAVETPHATDLALGGAIRDVAEHAEHFPQRLP